MAASDRTKTEVVGEWTYHGTRQRGVGVALSAVVLAALMLAGCGSSKGTTPPVPSWATSLGTGITIVPPGASETPGNGSPGGVVEALVADLNAGNLTAACGLYEPSEQAACTQALPGLSPHGTAFQNFELGYVAIDGNEALVGSIGTECVSNATPTCITNRDPAAIFSSGQTFFRLYNTALAELNSSSSENTYALAPCIKSGSDWYLVLPG